MLEIKIPKKEFFDEEKQEFIYTEACVLRLEHSLASISKWEGKHKKPFLSDAEKTVAETIDYIKCMTLNENVDPLVYKCLTNEQIHRITEYIDDDMTATTFNDGGEQGKGKREIITAEIVYYWMVALQIPFECQYWHFKKLMTLIKVVNIKQSPPKKRSKKELMSRNAALNAARRKKLGSKG